MDCSPQSPDRGFSPWRLLPLGVVAAGLVAFFAFSLDTFLSFDALARHRDALIAWRDDNYVLSAATFVLVYALLVAFCVPVGAWLTLAGGFLFGTVAGAMLVLVGATAGAVGIFVIARYALGGYLRSKAGNAVQRMEAGFRRNAFNYMLVLRLVPVFPFWLVNLVPAFLGVRLGTFAAATAVGIIPGTVVYAGAGNGLGAVFDAGGTPDLGIIFKPEILLPILGLVALSLLPVLFKWFRRGRA